MAGGATVTVRVNAASLTRRIAVAKVIDRLPLRMTAKRAMVLWVVNHARVKVWVGARRFVHHPDLVIEPDGTWIMEGMRDD